VIDPNTLTLPRFIAARGDPDSQGWVGITAPDA
jgi:hypothetical protein